MSKRFQEQTQKGLPAVMGITILNDPETGAPITIMDGTLITTMRTGAVTAVGAKYLAKKDSQVVTIIGAGTQERLNLEALNELLDIREARIASVTLEKTRKYVHEMSKKTRIIP